MLVRRRPATDALHRHGAERTARQAPEQRGDEAGLGGALLEALFAARTVWRRGREEQTLEIAATVTLESPQGPITANARRG